MSKFQVKTLKGSNFGKTINFSGQELKFDHVGVAEVKSEEILKQLINTYKGWLVIPGETVETPKKQSEKTNDKLVESLNVEIEKLNEKVTLRENTLKSVEKELADWKEVVDSLKEDKETLEQELANHKETNEKIIKELQLEITLLKKSVGELQTLASEFGIKEDKYKGLTKDKLIELILAESK